MHSESRVVLGNWNFEEFNNVIKFVEENTMKDKNEILATLYNNTGVVTYNLPEKLMVNERLKKAAELYKEPYTGLVIVANQTGQVEISIKSIGNVMMLVDKLIKEESKIDNSINLVSFLVVKYWAKGCMLLGQQEHAIDMLGDYIMMIPDSEEYNMVKSDLLDQKGNCYKEIKDYEQVIEDFQNAIFYGKKTVEDDSRILATKYYQIGICYEECEKWEKALEYLEQANTGYVNWMSCEQGTLYFNEGYASWELDEYEKAKQYFLKAYI